jgi:hypothetical protein
MRITQDGIRELSIDDIRTNIKRYENYYDITSEEFIKLWKEGRFEDTFWTNRWAMEWTFLKIAEEPGVILESDFDPERKDA